MKVHEIMTAHARCAGPENTLVEAAGLMRELDVGALPVCENDRIAGMITDRDIAVRAVADGRDPNTTMVREVMTAGVTYVLADQEVEEAARIMQEREIRRLPVVSSAKRLVGILSLGDIAMSSSPAFSGMTLREVSEPENPNGRQRKRAAMGAAAGAGVQPMRQPAAQDNGADEQPARGRSRGGAVRGASEQKRGGRKSQRQRGTAGTRKRAATRTRTTGARGGGRKTKRRAAR